MTNMIEVKTADLIGPALDWAVANAAGWPVEIKPHGQYSNASTGHKLKARSYRLWMVSDVDPEECTPSSDWSQGGPLIEKHTSTVTHAAYDAGWWAHSGNHIGEGKTPLIAACRAIVAAKLGDVVGVPTELITQ